MTLDKLNKGDVATITKLDCNDEFKSRFYSFGIIEGADVEIKAVSLKKQTIEVNVEDTLIALRFDEAKLIEVQK